MYWIFLVALTTSALAKFSVEGCPDEIADQFYDISKAPGPKHQGLAPELAVRCTKHSIHVNANSIPHYTYHQTTPNALRPWHLNVRIPREPKIAKRPTAIGDSTNGRQVTLGYIGFTVTGIPIFGPTEGPIPRREAFGDPVANCLLAMPDNQFCSRKKVIPGGCGGHTARTTFHNHFLAEACFQGERSLVAEPWKVAVNPEQPSGILGYAADGFAIHGRYEHMDGKPENPVITMQSSYRLKPGKSPNSLAFEAFEYVEHNDTSRYLDACNGHQHADGSAYHYHATDTFPYIIGCFKGTPYGVRSRFAQQDGFGCHS